MRLALFFPTGKVYGGKDMKGRSECNFFLKASLNFKANEKLPACS